MKKNIIIVVSIVIVIYGLIMFIILNKKSSISKGNNYVIVDSLNLKYEGNAFREITSDEISKANSNFKVYSDSIYLGNYKLKKAKVWNVFDSNNNFVKYDGNLIAYSDKLYINVLSLKSSNLTINDRNYIYSKYKISDYNNLLKSNVYDFSVNKDNYRLIILNNLDITNVNYMKNYNLVLLEKNGKYYEIIFNSGKYVSDLYEVIGIFNYNNHNRFYIGIKNTKSFLTDSPITSDYLYLYNNKINKVFSN